MSLLRHRIAHATKGRCQKPHQARRTHDRILTGIAKAAGIPFLGNKGEIGRNTTIGREDQQVMDGIAQCFATKEDVRLVRLKTHATSMNYKNRSVKSFSQRQTIEP